ncbi:MAG: NAD(P)/FAD-dependent oxidoreductase [candidate division KSB1 bacterium]|jgi:digeranylgeranylglycerophospholipid reductase|nr:NAD(P)/FAD-dependent oxidoreductase [candidate division KSB1 bacterium]
MMNESYDIVIVGAGPAGSTAARFAAMSGCNVLLLEKDREIGVPVRCGEAVSEISLNKFFEIRQGWIANRIEGVRLIAPDGTVVPVNHPDGGYILNRKVFDQDLAQMAGAEGATIVTKAYVSDLIVADGRVCGVQVEHLGETYRVRAKIVIGADGVESRVGRWAGLQTHVGLRDMESCVQMTLSNIDIDRRYCDFYFSSTLAPGGYVWVFPKDERTANVGLGVSGEYNRQKPAIKYLNEFVKNKFPGATRLITVAGGVPCAPFMKEIVRDGFMLVGDAAHQANPMTGGGIMASVIASRIAGETAAKAVKLNDVSQKALREYPEKWHETGGIVHQRSYRLKEVVYKLTDADLNRTAMKIDKLKPDKRTIISIFKTALFNHPKLIPDIIKVFMS